MGIRRVEPINAQEGGGLGGARQPTRVQALSSLKCYGFRCSRMLPMMMLIRVHGTEKCPRFGSPYFSFISLDSGIRSSGFGFMGQSTDWILGCLLPRNLAQDRRTWPKIQPRSRTPGLDLMAARAAACPILPAIAIQFLRAQNPPKLTECPARDEGRSQACGARNHEWKT